MGRRVHQRNHDLHKLGDRPRPAMRQYDWQGILVLRSDVNEVNPETVNLAAKLWKPIQCAFNPTPIVGVRQYSASACALASGTPWDQSVTVSLSGQRALASLSLRSSSSACGTWTLKGLTSFVAVGSTNSAAWSELPWALIGHRPADNIPAPPVAAAASMN